MHLYRPDFRVDKEGVREEGPYAGRKNPEYTRRPKMRRYRPPPRPDPEEYTEVEQPKKKKKKRKGPIYCPEGKIRCDSHLVLQLLFHHVGLFGFVKDQNTERAKAPHAKVPSVSFKPV